MWKNRYRVAILTASDLGAAGQREDQSGPLIKSRMRAEGCEVVDMILLPDDKEGLVIQLTKWCDEHIADLVLTTGGTGLSPRDQMPEATLEIAQRMVPGISEAIRAHSMKITPRAMLGRGVAVTRGRTLIINLPGSPKAVSESLDAILPSLEHGLDILCQKGKECARNEDLSVDICV